MTAHPFRDACKQGLCWAAVLVPWAYFVGMIDG